MVSVILPEEWGRFFTSKAISMCSSWLLECHVSHCPWPGSSPVSFARHSSVWRPSWNEEQCARRGVPSRGYNRVWMSSLWGRHSMKIMNKLTLTTVHTVLVDVCIYIYIYIWQRKVMDNCNNNNKYNIHAVIVGIYSWIISSIAMRIPEVNGHGFRSSVVPDTHLHDCPWCVSNSNESLLQLWSFISYKWP